MDFCISCHGCMTTSIRIQKTIHYSNRTGVRAMCSDCHAQGLDAQDDSQRSRPAARCGANSPEPSTRRRSLRRNAWSWPNENGAHEGGRLARMPQLPTASRAWTPTNRRHAGPRCTRSRRMKSRPASTAIKLRITSPGHEGRRGRRSVSLDGGQFRWGRPPAEHLLGVTDEKIYPFDDAFGFAAGCGYTGSPLPHLTGARCPSAMSTCSPCGFANGWVGKEVDHSGTAGLKKGETCVGCHEERAR